MLSLVSQAQLTRAQPGQPSPTRTSWFRRGPAPGPGRGWPVCLPGDRYSTLPGPPPVSGCNAHSHGVTRNFKLERGAAQPRPTVTVTYTGPAAAGTGASGGPGRPQAGGPEAPLTLASGILHQQSGECIFCILFLEGLPIFAYFAYCIAYFAYFC